MSEGRRLGHILMIVVMMSARTHPVSPFRASEKRLWLEVRIPRKVSCYHIPHVQIPITLKLHMFSIPQVFLSRTTQCVADALQVQTMPDKKS